MRRTTLTLGSNVIQGDERDDDESDCCNEDDGVIAEDSGNETKEEDPDANEIGESERGMAAAENAGHCAHCGRGFAGKGEDELAACGDVALDSIGVATLFEI